MATIPTHASTGKTSGSAPGGRKTSSGIAATGGPMTVHSNKGKVSKRTYAY